MTGESCGTCKYYRGIGSDKASGTCRRRAPRVHGHVSGWPSVVRTAWCVDLSEETTTETSARSGRETVIPLEGSITCTKG